MALSTFRDNLDLGIISATEMPFLGAVVESIIFITDTLPVACDMDCLLPLQLLIYLRF
jgi:hypothetical protein